MKNNMNRTSGNEQRSNAADISPQEQSISSPKKVDLLHPCCQRLQQLEKAVAELLNKPTEIPPEKDHMLLDSMNRIKSIEHDLQRTKKVRTYPRLILKLMNCPCLLASKSFIF